jgi:hypothetical protein
MVLPRVGFDPVIAQILDMVLETGAHKMPRAARLSRDLTTN